MATSPPSSMDMSLETEFPATGGDSPVSKSLVTTGAFVELPLATNDPNRSSTRSTASSASRGGALPKYYPRPRLTPPQRPPRATFQPIPPGSSLASTPDRPATLGLPTPARSVMVEEAALSEAVYKPTTTAPPPRSLPALLRPKGDASRPYDAMYELYRESHGTSDYLRNLRVFGSGLGSPWLWLAVYCLLALGPFVALVVGAINVRGCTAEPMVPVYLVVAGVAWLLKLSMNIYQTLLLACEESSPAVSQSSAGSSYKALGRSVLWQTVMSILSVFIFVWLIAGAVWVYRAFRPLDHVDADHPLFCQGYVYDVAFWTVTVQLVGLGVALVGTFLLATGLTLRQSRQAADTLDSSLA